jgi:hypothetical protein
MTYRPHQIILYTLLILFLAGCQLLPQTPVPVAAAGPTSTPTVTFTPWPAFPTAAPLPSVTPPGAPTLAPTGTPFPTGTPTPVVLGAIGFPPNVNPLTGLKVSDPSILNRRPVLVKVSNYPRTGRPHAGLSAADMVFEYYIGEYENRFVGVYYSQDASRIGPLRSGRLVDAQLTNEYGGILIYGNADPRVDKVLVDALGPRAVTFDDAPCPPVCGKDTHSIEGVFVDSAAATRFAAQNKINNEKPDLVGMIFDARLPNGQGPGGFLGVSFGPDDRGEWRFDPASGRYLRWIEDERPGNKFVQIPLVDRNNGKQIAIENVIILFTKYTELLPTMFEMEVAGNTSGQRAVLFRDGEMVEGSWRSNGLNQPLTISNGWGAAMALKPGKSWIIMVGLSSDLAQKEPGRWELEYHTK